MKSGVSPNGNEASANMLGLIELLDVWLAGVGLKYRNVYFNKSTVNKS